LDDVRQKRSESRKQNVKRARVVVEMIAAFLSKAAAVYVLLGWSLLSTTSASLLVPHPVAASDRLWFSLDLWRSRSRLLNLRILLDLLVSYLVILPLASYLWVIDEVFFSGFHKIDIVEPIIVVSVPRAGTTSFHRMLALDERFATPRMLELVMPFICVHKVLYCLKNRFPAALARIELVLKWISGVTPAVEARHPVGLFLPDAEVWHWVGIGAMRTFPVAKYWYKHYAFCDIDRSRSMRFHQTLCKKSMYNQGHGNKRLLLRSHLSHCFEDFQLLYPDAIYAGIIRDPVAVLRSMAGLSICIAKHTSGVNLLASPTIDTELLDRSKGTAWAGLFVAVLSDMMGREAEVYGKSSQNLKRSSYVKFPHFKDNPLIELGKLYTDIGIPMTVQFEWAIQQGLRHHETYKIRQRYENPSLEDLNVDVAEYLNLPSVRRYSCLLADS
jgi:hypothetical protein